MPRKKLGVIREFSVISLCLWGNGGAFLSQLLFGEGLNYNVDLKKLKKNVSTFSHNICCLPVEVEK